MRIAVLFTLFFLIVFPVQAQDQKEQLVQALRSDGSPLEAEVLSRYVELEMSPEWWAIMLDPGESRGVRQSLRVILSNLIDMANRNGWGDAARLNQDTGRKGNSPPVIAMLDSWKGKMQVKIVMNFVPDETSKKQTSDGLDRMGYPISSWAKPRSGKFFLTVVYDPKVTKLQTKMSPDASTYMVTAPGYTYWRQGDIDDLFKRGN